MRMNGNDLAACAVIALGVGGVVVGSLLGVGNQAVTLPAVNPQPVVVDMPAEPEPTATPEPTPEPTPTVETVHFSATGDDLIHDGIFCRLRSAAATTTILTPPTQPCRATTTSLM